MVVSVLTQIVGTLLTGSAVTGDCGLRRSIFEGGLDKIRIHDCKTDTVVVKRLDILMGLEDVGVTQDSVNQNLGLKGNFLVIGRSYIAILKRIINSSRVVRLRVEDFSVNDPETTYTVFDFESKNRKETLLDER